MCPDTAKNASAPGIGLFDLVPLGDYLSDNFSLVVCSSSLKGEDTLRAANVAGLAIRLGRVDMAYFFSHFFLNFSE